MPEDDNTNSDAWVPDRSEPDYPPMTPQAVKESGGESTRRKER